MRLPPQNGRIAADMEELQQALETAARLEAVADRQRRLTTDRAARPVLVVSTAGLPALVPFPQHAMAHRGFVLAAALVVAFILGRCFLRRRQTAKRAAEASPPSAGSSHAIGVGAPTPPLAAPDASAASYDGELALELVLSQSGSRRLVSLAPLICKRWAGAGLAERAQRRRLRLMERRREASIVQLPSAGVGEEPLRVVLEDAALAERLRPAAAAPAWGHSPAPWYL